MAWLKESFPSASRVAEALAPGGPAGLEIVRLPEREFAVFFAETFFTVGFFIELPVDSRASIVGATATVKIVNHSVQPWCGLSCYARVAQATELHRRNSVTTRSFSRTVTQNDRLHRASLLFVAQLKDQLQRKLDFPVGSRRRIKRARAANRRTVLIEERAVGQRGVKV